MYFTGGGVMTLGQKILHARTALGLSQRAVCGDVITRNMLSQIEHGTAKPSMDTLKYLASRLEKPVSYFLEEESVVSPNQQLMMQAKACFDRGQHAQVLRMLEDYKAPDAICDTERAFLSVLSALQLAQQALGENKQPLARMLLESTARWEKELWMLPELRARRVRLQGALRGQNLMRLCEELPGVDDDLLLRARAELEAGNPMRAGQLLDAAETRDDGWQLLRGRAYFGQRCYREAVACLLEAESADPESVYPLLEKAYRELEDYKQAYYYACKQRER